MNYALYPGCLILQRMPEYEAAARAVLGALGIDLEIVQDAVCCGAPIAESFTADWIYLSIYNLARVEQMGYDTVVTLCGSCTNSLTRAGLALEDETVRSEARRRLAPMGLRVPGHIEVKHLIKMLTEHEGELRSRITHPLKLQIALTNPCQVFRPGDIMGFDDPMNPTSTRRLVELTGASVLDYGGENECCGATVYLADGKISLAAGRRKLEATVGADALVHSCGNCHLLLRHFQRAINGGRKEQRQEALFLPQLIGLAMGLPEQALGVKENRWR